MKIYKNNKTYSPDAECSCRMYLTATQRVSRRKYNAPTHGGACTNIYMYIAKDLDVDVDVDDGVDIDTY